jgi:hypothetical protein
LSGTDPPEDPRAIAAGALVELRRRVDAHFDAAVHRTPSAFACRAGCSSCCVAFSVAPIEADRLRAALTRLAVAEPALRRRLRDQGTQAERRACALLVDDRCSVYDERPIICRSHGLPVRATLDDGRVHTSVCPLNFVDTVAPAASTLSLDAVNAPLSVIGRMWDPDGERVAIAAIAAED